MDDTPPQLEQSIDDTPPQLEQSIDDNPPQKLNFKISSGLKSVLGKDLITNDFVAIFELVKNSFDARAENVTISFEEKDNVIHKIYVVDNGKGMDYDDLVNKWLFVAYSAKQDGSEDDNDSIVYAGNKGVGRLSSDRIGGRLKLEAKSINDSLVHSLDVNWGDFEQDSKKNFEKIDIAYSTQSLFTPIPNITLPENSGVILEISELRDAPSWDRMKLLRLKRHLAKLINPFGDATSPLKLILSCDKEKKEDLKAIENCKEGEQDQPDVVNGIVRNAIFDLLKTKTTWFQVDLDNEGYFVSTLVDRGELIYKIKESADLYPELMGSEFSTEIFYLNQSAKQNFKLRTGSHAVNFGSLFLFRNSFRVFPIGDETDDYWNIDYRHQQGYARTLGTRDIMGRVDIAGPESKFKESSSRDQGLVETEASKQLYDYVVNKCLKRLQNYVVGVTWQDSIDKTYDTAQRLNLDENRANIIELVSKLSGSKTIELLEYSNNIVDVLNEKSSFFENSVERLAKLATTIDDKDLQVNILQARKKFAELKAAELEALEIATKEFTARIKAEKATEIQKKLRVEAEKEAKGFNVAYEEEKKRNLFLLSSDNRDKEQLESFLHQIIIYASSAKQNVTSTLLKISNPSYEIDKEEIGNSLGDLLESIEKVMTTSRFATTANFKLDSTKITDDICQYIQQYINTISTAYNSRIQIKVELHSKPFVTTFTPVELGMVLDNLVSNAKKSRASNIVFSISDEINGIIEITIEDNGKGLDKSLLEPMRIFEKGLTTTRGSGLGLFHSKKQIEKMGGELILPDKQPARGFKIIMRLRKT
jgi:signal transduction histidine kinase